MSASSQRPWSLPPPPDSYQKYGSKPLPPTPQRISLFDTPPRRAPQVPRPSVDGHIGASNPSQIKVKPKRRSMLGGFAGSGRREEAPPKLETDRLPPPTVTRLTTPTYHSSDRKISQLTGLEPLAKPISNFSFGQPRGDEYIVSPLSSTSSYADDLVDNISDLDELDPTHQSVRGSSLWPGPLVLQKSGSGSGDRMIDGADLRASQRSSMARADGTDAPRRQQISRNSGTEFHEPGPPRHPTPPSRSRDQSTGSLDRQPHSLSLTWEPREGFSSRAARSDTRKPAPPPPEMRAHSRDSDGGRSASRGSDGSFGTGNHPLKTPYPLPNKKFGLNESGWDTDSDDEKERRRGSSLGAMASKFAKKVKPFRRDQGIVEITSPEYRSGRLAPGGMSTGSSASASVTSVRSSGSAGGPAGHPGPREHVILTNRARDADGPDTPAPQPMGLLQRTQGALADAMKTAGIQSKSDRKRESLKGKIRVIPEGYPVYQRSNGEEQE